MFSAGCDAPSLKFVRRRLLVPATGSSAPAGWSLVPVFESGGPFVASGAYHLPLFKGVPSWTLIQVSDEMADGFECQLPRNLLQCFTCVAPWQSSFVATLLPSCPKLLGAKSNRAPCHAHLQKELYYSCLLCLGALKPHAANAAAFHPSKWCLLTSTYT